MLSWATTTPALVTSTTMKPRSAVGSLAGRRGSKSKLWETRSATSPPVSDAATRSAGSGLVVTRVSSNAGFTGA